MSLNYVTLGSNNVVQARRFFDPLFAIIDGVVVAEHLPHAICYEMRGGGRVWVVSPFNGETATPGNGTMVGFQCATIDEVRSAHAIGLSLGGACEGPPGPRPQYAPGLFCAYLRDLDDNKISFVHSEEDA